MFALLYATGSTDKDSLLRLKAADALEKLTGAGQRRIITPLTGGQVNAVVVEGLKARQLQGPKESIIQGEDIPLGETLDKVFGDESQTEIYLTALLDFTSGSPAELWQLIEGEVGETVVREMQLSLQLLVLTGFQPEMAAHLKNQYPSGLRQLARLNKNEWRGIIDRASADLNHPAIPKVIGQVGDETERERYAAKLKELTQEAFPLAAVVREIQPPHRKRTHFRLC